MSWNREIKNSRNKAIKLGRHLVRRVGTAVRDYGMIEEGDRVMVCISGGKDSYALLDLLTAFRRNAPIDFAIEAVHLDKKFPGFPRETLETYFKTLDVPWRIIEQDIYSTVKRVIPEGKTMCGLCSRLRRGALYRFAEENGMNKVALGHHRDDMVETLFLNMFFGGTLKGMPPKLLSDSGKHVVIRPMAYVGEKHVERYVKLKGFPVIPGNLCGTPPNMQRHAVKEMLNDWRKRYPGRVETIFNSMQNVVPSQLADRKLFDFSFGSEEEAEASIALAEKRDGEQDQS